MSIIFFENELKKISLSPEQRMKVKNHFNDIRIILNNLSFSNIQQQGSFGRRTVIAGKEKDGFDLDIAIVIDDKTIPEKYKFILKNKLESKYSGNTQSVSIKEKAIKIEVSSNFSIDITFIYKDSFQELVYNNFSQSGETSFALKFRDMFKEKNDHFNSLVYLTRLYKHIRDASKDFHIKSFPLEIMLYNSFISKSNLQNSMSSTLKEMEYLIDSMKNNYEFIINPANKNDEIKTGILSDLELENLKILNSLVLKVIDEAIINNKSISNLERKYKTLQELHSQFNNSILGSESNFSKGMVFGGNILK